MEFPRLVGTFSIVAVIGLATIAHAAESRLTSIPASYEHQRSVVSPPVVPSTQADSAKTEEDECG